MAMALRALRGWLLASLLLVGGCGEIGRIVLDVDFPDPDTELRTRSLVVIVREVDQQGSDGCTSLWSSGTSGLGQSESVVEYPNRVPIRASAVDLDLYPELTLLVYAHPTLDVDVENPTAGAVAGGCVQEAVDPNSTQELLVELEPAP